MNPERSHTHSSGKRHLESHHHSKSRHSSPSRHRENSSHHRDSSNRKNHSHSHHISSHHHSRGRSKGRKHSPFAESHTSGELAHCACHVPCPCRYDSCTQGADIFTSVLGPTADETFILGLQTLFGYYTSTEELGHSGDPEHPENSEHFKSLGIPGHRNREEVVLNITNAPVSFKDNPIQAVPESTSSESQTAYLTKHSQLQATSRTSHGHSQTESTILEEEGSQTGSLPMDHEGSQTSEVSFSNSESQTHRKKENNGDVNSEIASEVCLGKDGKRCPCPLCCATRKNGALRTVRVSSKCVCSPNNGRKKDSLYKRHGKSVCSCAYSSTEYGGYTTESTESNNIDHILIKQQHGDVGQVKYAITRITKFASYTTFEIMRSTKKKPKSMPSSIEGVFVLRNNQVTQ